MYICVFLSQSCLRFTYSRKRELIHRTRPPTRRWDPMRSDQTKTSTNTNTNTRPDQGHTRTKTKTKNQKLKTKKKTKKNKKDKTKKTRRASQNMNPNLDPRPSPLTLTLTCSMSSALTPAYQGRARSAVSRRIAFYTIKSTQSKRAI